MDISITKTYLPSRMADALFLTLPRRLAGLAQGTNTRNTPPPDHTVRMLERVLIPTELIADDILPPTPAPDAAAVTEVPAGSTPASLGLAPLGVLPENFFDHTSVDFGWDHRKLQVMFDEAIKRFSGFERPLSSERSHAVGRMADPGTRTLDSLRYALSYNIFTRQLEFMLKNQGFDLPTLVRQGGAFTDTSGLLNIKVKLVDPHVRGFTSGWLESVDYGFRETQQGQSVGFGTNATLNQNTSDIAGSLAPPEPGTVDSQTHPSQGVTVSLSASTSDSSTATLKTMPKHLAKNTEVPWERVNAHAIIELTLNARNTRDLINAPGGQVKMAFLVRNALELGVSPEIAIDHRLVHPKGVKVPSGVFVPAHGATAHGVPDDKLDAVRAAFALPRLTDAIAIHVHVTPDGRFIVGDQVLAAPQFAAQVLGNTNLSGQSLVLVTGGGDAAAPDTVSAAEALAIATERPVIATSSPVNIMQDGAVLAAQLDTRAGTDTPNRRGFRLGRWVQIVRHTKWTERMKLSHDLAQALRESGIEVGDMPAFVPPPRNISSRGSSGFFPTFDQPLGPVHEEEESDASEGSEGSDESQLTFQSRPRKPKAEPTAGPSSSRPRDPREESIGEPSGSQRP